MYFSFNTCCLQGMPTCIIARTFKGKNFPDIENLLNWHGKALGDKTDAIIQHLQGLISNPDAPNLPIQSPTQDTPAVEIGGIALSSPPAYNKGDSLATRQAYGNALEKIATSSKAVVALDGDMKNSTFSQTMFKVDAGRFIECFICEQNMIGVGIGVSCRDRTVAFASTFSAFLTRYSLCSKKYLFKKLLT